MFGLNWQQVGVIVVVISAIAAVLVWANQRDVKSNKRDELLDQVRALSMKIGDLLMQNGSDQSFRDLLPEARAIDELHRQVLGKPGYLVLTINDILDRQKQTEHAKLVEC